MKNQRIICLIVFVWATGINSISAQAPVLKIDNDLLYGSSPTIGTSINYNVEMMLNDCIMLYGANQDSRARSLTMGNNQMARGEAANIICVARLENVTNSSGARRFDFSQGCAENNKSSASVRVLFGNQTPDSPRGGSNETAFDIEMEENRVLMIDNNETPLGQTGERVWLRVNASAGNTASISINEDTNRGQCLVAVVESGGNGATIAILDPKSREDLSFITDRNVYLIPVIRARRITENGQNVLLYEIGDPKRNAKVVVEETE